MVLAKGIEGCCKLERLLVPWMVSGLRRSGGNEMKADWVMIFVLLSFMQRELKFLRRCGSS